MGKGGKAGRNPLALLRGGKSVDELFGELDADGGGSLERAELLQTKTHTNAAGVVVLIDCANCTLNAMKSFVLSVRFPISDIATPRLTFSCHH